MNTSEMKVDYSDYDPMPDAKSILIDLLTNPEIKKMWGDDVDVQIADWVRSIRDDLVPWLRAELEREDAR
jgi:hypothetical protein